MQGSHEIISLDNLAYYLPYSDTFLLVTRIKYFGLKGQMKLPDFYGIHQLFSLCCTNTGSSCLIENFHCSSGNDKIPMSFCCHLRTLERGDLGL